LSQLRRARFLGREEVSAARTEPAPPPPDPAAARTGGAGRRSLRPRPHLDSRGRHGIMNRMPADYSALMTAIAPAMSLLSMDPAANRHLELFAGGFYWSDEVSPSYSRRVPGRETLVFRYVIAYRASLIRANPDSALQDACTLFKQRFQHGRVLLRNAVHRTWGPSARQALRRLRCRSLERDSPPSIRCRLRKHARPFGPTPSHRSGVGDGTGLSLSNRGHRQASTVPRQSLRYSAKVGPQAPCADSPVSQDRFCRP